MDIYPSKAQFSTNETVTLCLICDDVLPISVHVRVLLLSKTVWEQNIVLTENKTTVSIGAFSATFAGYGVNVYQQNDLEMLELVGHSYAMSNSAPGVSYYADEVTDSVEDVLEDVLASLDK